MMAADERAAAKSAAYVIAAAMPTPSNARVQRVAKLEGQAVAAHSAPGTRAATMNEQQLGRRCQQRMTSSSARTAAAADAAGEGRQQVQWRRSQQDSMPMEAHSLCRLKRHGLCPP